MQLKLHMVTIEDLVPGDHFLRKLEAALNLSFVYEETTPLYSRKYGRPPIDPVVMVKYLLIGFPYVKSYGRYGKRILARGHKARQRANHKINGTANIGNREIRFGRYS